MPNPGQPNQDVECTTDVKLILSYGGLCNWKRHHGVFSVRLHGKASSADQEGVARAQRELPSILNNFRLEDVFNYDETGLYYRQAVSGYKYCILTKLLCMLMLSL